MIIFPVTYTSEDIKRIFKEAPTDRPLCDFVGKDCAVEIHAHILLCDRCYKLVIGYLSKYPY